MIDMIQSLLKCFKFYSTGQFDCLKFSFESGLERKPKRIRNDEFSVFP